MSLGVDAVLVELLGGVYDIKIGFDGDIETEDAFDTAIIVSLFTDARANVSEVPETHRRRGWLGNEQTPGVEMGSKLWLHEQARLTRTVMNAIADQARAALEWFVDNDLAEAIADVEVSSNPVTGRLLLSVQIERTPSRIEPRLYDLWDQSGKRF